MSYDISNKYKPEFLREMSPEDVEQLLDEAQQRYFELRHQSSPHGRVKHVPRPHLHKKVKRDIARFKTILKEKLT